MQLDLPAGHERETETDRQKQRDTQRETKRQRHTQRHRKRAGKKEMRERGGGGRERDREREREQEKRRFSNACMQLGKSPYCMHGHCKQTTEKEIQQPFVDLRGALNNYIDN